MMVRLPIDPNQCYQRRVELVEECRRPKSFGGRPEDKLFCAGIAIFSVYFKGILVAQIKLTAKKHQVV